MNSVILSSVLQYTTPVEKGIIQLVLKNEVSNETIELLYKHSLHSGCLDLLKYLVEEANYKVKMYSYLNAAQNGHLNILQYLKDKVPVDRRICEVAALNNHFDIVKWSYSMCYPVMTNLCYGAAYNDNFEMLRWLRERLSPWDYRVPECIARNNNFEMFYWVCENNCPMDKWTYTTAVSYNCREIVEWIKIYKPELTL